MSALDATRVVVDKRRAEAASMIGGTDPFEFTTIRKAVRCTRDLSGKISALLVFVTVTVTCPTLQGNSLWLLAP